MKWQYFIDFMLAAFLFSACVHDYPSMTDDGEMGIDPTLIEVSVEVQLDISLKPLQFKSGAKDSAGNYQRRFIVEVRQDGKTVVNQIKIINEPSSSKLSLPLRLKLKALEYTLAVWTDYVYAGTESDLYYNTADLEGVSFTAPYMGSVDRRDCLYGTTALDLRSYRDKWNIDVKARVEMTQPYAKYEIIATDVEDFNKHMRRKRGGSREFTATVLYDFYFPTVFNVWTGRPDQSGLGVAFTVPVHVPADESGECVIASDYIFTGNSGSVMPLTIELHDNEGNLFARTTGLQVPYQRGYQTTLRGSFLTHGIDNGVDIDTEFDGDIDVNIDDLLK